MIQIITYKTKHKTVDGKKITKGMTVYKYNEDAPNCIGKGKVKVHDDSWGVGFPGGGYCSAKELYADKKKCAFAYIDEFHKEIKEIEKEAKERVKFYQQQIAELSKVV